MKRKLLLLILVAILVLPVTAAKNKEKFPKKIANAIEKVYEEGKGNGIYNIQYLKSYSFAAPMGTVYHVILFKAELPKNLEKTYYLFMRFYKENGGNEGKLIIDHIAPFYSYTGEFFTVSLSILPGKFKTVFAIGDKDGKDVGTAIFDLNVPEVLREKEITWSTPFFMKRFERAQPLLGITVVPEAFYIGGGKFLPYLENKFKAEEHPELFFFVYGVGEKEDGMAQGEVHFQINKDGKKVVEYRTLPLRGRGGRGIVDQPLVFKRANGKPLEKGNYELEVKIKDQIRGKEVKVVIPFEII
ncbi:MAG: hypothetical protein J7L62_02785 [Candidatus Aminicenantes bacterium]|nr:hypothetical protein [Candidatus Aminicenantes bacterium]